MADSDFPYLEAARARDPAAFEFLVRKYQDRLFHFMVYHTGSRENAQECVQETFIRFFTQLDSFRGESSLFTWLSRIAMNFAISQKRKKSPTPSVYVECAYEELPENRVMSDEITAQVQKAVRELPDEFRQVIILREMEGAEYQQIAEILEIPVGTVKSRIYRAREMLAERLKDV